MATSRPKAARIALERAFEPSMMKRRGRAGSRPRSMRLSISACTVAAFFVAPSNSPSGFLSPFASTPIAATRVLVHVNAVDLDHQQPEAGKITRHPFLQSRRRQRDKTPGGGRFRQTRAVGRRHVTFGQAHRTFELARRDVDQHLVHGPLTEPVFRHRTFPTGKSLLLAIEATKARAFNRHLAARERDLDSVELHVKVWCVLIT